MIRHVAKFHRATSLSPKVIEAQMLNFKPIFYPLCKKNCWGNPRPHWVCSSKPWTFYSTCKNFGAHSS